MNSRIIHCHNCNQEMSANTDICPNCGFSMKNFYNSIIKQEEKQKRNQDIKKKELIDQSSNLTSRRMPLISIIFTIIACLLFIATIYFLLKSAPDMDLNYTKAQIQEMNYQRYVYAGAIFLSGCFMEAISFALMCLDGIAYNTRMTNMFLLDQYKNNEKE